MQFDVNLNMTFEVDDDEWAAFLEMNFADEDGNYVEDEAIFEGAVEQFLEEQLGYEELDTISGRAWVCSVDSGSIL